MPDARNVCCSFSLIPPSNPFPHPPTSLQRICATRSPLIPVGTARATTTGWEATRVTARRARSTAAGPTARLFASVVGESTALQGTCCCPSGHLAMSTASGLTACPLAALWHLRLRFTALTVHCPCTVRHDVRHTVHGLEVAPDQHLAKGLYLFIRRLQRSLSHMTVCVFQAPSKVTQSRGCSQCTVPSWHCYPVL